MNSLSAAVKSPLALDDTLGMMNVTAAGYNLIVTADEEDSILRDWFGERLTDSNGITRD